MNNEDITFCVRETVVLREIHSVWFVIDWTRQYFEGPQPLLRLDEMGKKIWEQLLTKKSCKEISNEFHNQYPRENVNKIFKDVIRFCTTLHLHNYLEIIV